MTGLSTFLEDFGTQSVTASPNYSEELLESERLEAFDKGYRAGWDDAIKAKADDTAQMSSDFAQTLQDLSFTYHEVHAQVFANLRPLFDEILQKILPDIARDTLGNHIADHLSQVARDLGTVEVTIAVAPGAGEQVTHMVNDAQVSLPMQVVETSDLRDGQAELRFAGREVSLDMADVTKQISQALEAVIHESTQEQGYG